MAWRTKSIEPHSSFSRVEHGVERGDVLDVAGDHQLAADLLGERPDAAPEGLALIGERDLRALSGERRAAPQAMELWFATPITSPRLPAIRSPMMSLRSSVRHALEGEARIGAAEAEGVRQDTVEPDAVAALA